MDIKDFTIKAANSATLKFGDISETTTCHRLSHKSDTPCRGPHHPCPALEVMKTKEPTIVEHIHYDREGMPRYVEVHCYPILDGNGDVAMVTEYCLDITERKIAEKNLRKTLDDLETSNKELQQFAYVASHDLQEPLRMISSYTQLLEKRYKDKLDADGLEFISYAVDGAVRMQRLINDLLDYSRVGTREQPFEIVYTELILTQVLQNLSMVIEENNVAITHENLPSVMGDLFQLRQLFQNLITNAIKFKAEEPPQIHISAVKREKDWLFSFRDNGIGIDPRYRERIFLIFQRLHTREVYPGTGIGLAICKKIVERHGGSIWVESEPGKGATFHFTIPETGES
ncbi:MAG: PAS domain-containing protein [Nitrospirales bacterium]|nr:PAS domain-containing protein [Nitrospirales bacterium]